MIGLGNLRITDCPIIWRKPISIENKQSFKPITFEESVIFMIGTTNDYKNIKLKKSSSAPWKETSCWKSWWPQEHNLKLLLDQRTDVCMIFMNTQPWKINNTLEIGLLMSPLKYSFLNTMCTCINCARKLAAPIARNMSDQNSDSFFIFSLSLKAKTYRKITK